VRAVLVHGEGRGFCAGLDAKAVAHPLSFASNIRELLHRPGGELSNLAQVVSQTSKDHVSCDRPITLYQTLFAGCRVPVATHPGAGDLRDSRSLLWRRIPGVSSIQNQPNTNVLRVRSRGSVSGQRKHA
jgi:hypothetical protein